MIRQYDIVKILKSVIESLEVVVKVNSSTDNGDGTFTIETCNTQYLNTCTTFVNGGNDYIVKSFVNDESIIIRGSPVITDDFTIRAPAFIPDTPMGTDSQLVQDSSNIKRLPLIWLLEDFATEFNFSDSNPASPRVRLFFLNQNLESDWLQDQHRKECIDPMRNLCDLLLEAIKKKVSGKLYRFTVKNRLRFGQYRDKNQNKKKILDEDLSGVELDIEIPLKNWSIPCKNC